MRARILFFGGAALAALSAVLACNAITGASDLSPCEGAECTNLGSSSGNVDGGPGEDAGDGGADSALPPTCNGSEKRCSGNVAAHCVSGKFETTTCAETCLGGDCVPFPSCRTSDAGAGCGADGGTASCCETLPVPGGTYARYNDDSKTATISAFALDKLEVTVGRFRAFVEAGEGTLAKPPVAGVGAHPKIPNSGWNAEWNTAGAQLLPKDRAALEAQLLGGTWTAMPGANELKPITSVSWFVAFAFCAWDGGRLPTNGEWGFAASGGAEQRIYPWSNPPAATTVDPSFAAYDCTVSPPAYNCQPVFGLRCADNSTCATQGTLCPDNSTCNSVQTGTTCGGCTSPADVAIVGSYTKGAGRFGHLDLGGNAAEWVLDASGNRSTIVLSSPCNDCASIVPGAPGGATLQPIDDTWMIFRGGHWEVTASPPVELQNVNLNASALPFDSRSARVGFRCAR